MLSCNNNQTYFPIFLTFWVLKLDKFKNDSQPPNILPYFQHFVYIKIR